MLKVYIVLPQVQAQNLNSLVYKKKKKDLCSSSVGTHRT